jgi:hypothetical protein
MIATVETAHFDKIDLAMNMMPFVGSTEKRDDNCGVGLKLSSKLEVCDTLNYGH